MATKVSELAAAEAELGRWQIIVDYLRTHQPAPRAARRNGRAPRITAAQAAEQVLRANGGPMTTPAIFDAITAIPGVKMKDKDGMYKTLDRDKARFRKVGPGLWELATPDQER